MTVNPINGQSNPPAQISGTQNKSGEEAFNQFAKSEGYDKGDMESAINERTRLTRTKRAERGRRKTTNSLFVLSEDGNSEEEAVYRTVMVDGVLFTLRLLAVA